MGKAPAQHRIPRFARVSLNMSVEVGVGGCFPKSHTYCLFLGARWVVDPGAK